MTLHERLAAAKQTADELIKQQQQIQQAAQQNQIALIRVDTEIALLEQLIKADAQPKTRGRKPKLEAVA